MEKKKSSIRAQFGRRAGAYARSESHARDRDLDLLLEHLDLRAQDRVLDVATGTGFTAIALRPHVRAVIGLDLTHGMLLEAHRLASALRIDWVEGDVEALPFPDRAFSVVTTRRAPHHFAHLDRAIEEMLRVLQPGGRIGIVDQINPEDAAAIRLMDELEVLRDSSHVRSLPVSEWRAVFGRHAIALTFQDVVEVRQPFERWLDLADTDSGRRRAIDRALQNATADTRRQIGYVDTPERAFMKRWMVLVGQKRERGNAGTRERETT